MTNIGVKQISIRLLPDGFSFLNQYHPILPGADFSKRLQETMLELVTSQADDSFIERCSVENTRFCITPLEIAAPLAEQMYRVSLPESEEEENRIELQDENAGIRFTFGIDSELYHFILRNWPEISFTHPLFELFLRSSAQVAECSNCMIAEAGENHLNLLTFNEGKLLIANRFEDGGVNNHLYHLMNCWKQSNLDVLEDKLFLYTEIEDLKKNIQQYIKQCEL